MFGNFKIFFIAILSSSLSVSNDGCEIILQPDLDGGCTFAEIQLLHPTIGVELTQICGSSIDSEFLQEQPIVIYPEAIDSMNYSLVMVDKIWDGSLFLQWLVTDVDGEVMRNGVKVTDGNTIAGKFHIRIRTYFKIS